ncbi:MAG: hypothetical protein ACD_67C00079G0001 [uncultured bacterium]|nr:MAG: hypothetical protein ACD_67C00079G0001 [uncultured bacterium]
MNQKMKLWIVANLIVFGFFLVPQKSNASYWSTIGSGGFSTGQANYTNIAFSPLTNEPYVAYADVTNSSKATVKKFDGTSWVSVGVQGFSADTANFIRLAFNPLTNEPYVAYRNGSSWKLTVQKFNGSSWEYVGVADFSPDDADYISLAFNPGNNQPYVAFRDATNSLSKLTVMTFNGSSWVTVGNAQFSTDSITYTALAFKSSTNEPYVAFSENGKLSIMKFNNSNWEYVGTSEMYTLDNFAGSNNLDLSFNPISNEPYVVYADYTSSKSLVKKFNGSSWISVGDNFLSIGEGFGFSIKFKPSSNEPYVAYFDDAYSNKANIRKFNGTSWIDAGSNAFSPGTVSYTSLAFNPSTNKPYVAFQDFSNYSYKARVMRGDYEIMAPIFIPVSEKFLDTKTVTISTATSGATIHYTTDGSTPTSGSPLYTEPITISSSQTIKAVAIKSGLADSDIVTETYTIISSTPVHRFWSPKNRGHFYTSSESERAQMVAAYSPSEWTYEGVAYNSFGESAGNLVPVYRFWSAQNQHHFYTASEDEKNSVDANYTDNEWKYEGIAYYAYTTQEANTKPVYRFWSAQNKVHFYTGEESEKNSTDANYSDNEWKLEGAAWYVPVN